MFHHRDTTAKRLDLGPQDIDVLEEFSPCWSGVWFLEKHADVLVRRLASVLGPEIESVAKQTIPLLPVLNSQKTNAGNPELVDGVLRKARGGFLECLETRRRAEPLLFLKNVIEGSAAVLAPQHRGSFQIYDLIHGLDLEARTLGLEVANLLKFGLEFVGHAR